MQNSCKILCHQCHQCQGFTGVIFVLFFFSVKCSICKSVSDTYDPYLDIAVEIRVCYRAITITTMSINVCEIFFCSPNLLLQY